MRTRLRKLLWRRSDESGMSLIEMVIGLALFSVVIVSVDSSLTVVQERSVQVTNGIEALDNIQAAQEALTRDIESATAWTTPAVPSSATPATVNWSSGLVFTTELNEALATVTVALNTTTHVLTVTCADLNSDSACAGHAGGTQTQAQVANIDSSSTVVLSTAEVTSTINSVTTNTFYFTSVATTLVLDSPSVTAARVSKTTLTSPSVIPYNIVYACQTAASAEGASGAC
jgi:prepilin-type N-terminal cleavage/methylation domain-containing protein